MHWAKVSDGNAKGLMNWAAFVKAVAALPEGQLWRHNQAGDLPGTDLAINGPQLASLVNANRGKRGFTYTHKPLTRENKAFIRHANRNGFTVNVSADSLAEADTKARANVGPVVCVLPAEMANERTFTTPEGRKGVVCPAARADLEGISCATCQMCAIPTRKAIIGFPAHGAAAKTVSQRSTLNIVKE
jgi:hypothetical protein